MKKQILSIGLLLTLAMMISGCLGSMSGIANNLAGGDTADSSGGDIEQQSKVLIDTLRKGAKNMLLAYSNMEEAAGNKIKAAQYREAADQLNENCSTEEIGKSLETIKEAQADQEAQEQQYLHTKEAKASLSKSIVFFTDSIGDDTKFTRLAPQFIQDATSQILQNPMLASKLQSALDVIKVAADTLPGQISNAGGTLSNLIEYMKGHDIPDVTPEEKKALEKELEEDVTIEDSKLV